MSTLAASQRQLETSWQTLATRWRELSGLWPDAQGQRFANGYVAPLEDRMRALLQELGRTVELDGQARRSVRPVNG